MITGSRIYSVNLQDIFHNPYNLEKDNSNEFLNNIIRYSLPLIGGLFIN